MQIGTEVWWNIQFQYIIVGELAMQFKKTARRAGAILEGLLSQRGIVQPKQCPDNTRSKKGEEEKIQRSPSENRGVQSENSGSKE